jgi:hypothetical protein
MNTRGEEVPGTISVFVPVGYASASSAKELPVRSRSEFVIGMLDNHKHNTDKMLDRIQARLTAQFSDVQFRRAKKPEAGRPAPSQVLETLADCVAVINGIGD